MPLSVFKKTFKKNKRFPRKTKERRGCLVAAVRQHLAAEKAESKVSQGEGRRRCVVSVRGVVSA
jgi:hypothetical protein